MGAGPLTQLVLPDLPAPPAGTSIVLFSPAQWTWLRQTIAYQYTALQAIFAALGPLTASEEGIMSSLADLTTAVGRINDDVTKAKTSIDQAVTLLQNMPAAGTLTPDQQNALDAAVSTLNSASGSLETETTALTGAEPSNAGAPSAPTTS